MTIGKRDLAYFIFFVAVAWVLYLGRGIVAPFLLAAVFAYILNPLVSFLSRKTTLSRTAAIILIYIILIGGLGFVLSFVWSRFAQESAEFNSATRDFFFQATSQINQMPAYVQPAVLSLLESARHTIVMSPQRIATILPGAINRIVSLFIFLVATFYFLKDGQKFINQFLGFLPAETKFQIEIIMHKINAVLGNYIRAQLLLVTIMSTLTFLALTIIGVRYSVVLAIFTGLAETVPFVGPVVSAALAIFITYTDGVTHFGFDPIIQVLVVGLVYAVLRQMEDIFIIPQVMGRMTKLHPLVILFSALLGGHLFGVIGFLIAVPVVASSRVILEHIHDLLNTKKAPKSE